MQEYEDEYDENLYDIIRIEAKDGSGCIEIIHPKVLLTVKRAESWKDFWRDTFISFAILGAFILIFIGGNYMVAGFFALFCIGFARLFCTYVEEICCRDKFMDVKCKFTEHKIEYSQIECAYDEKYKFIIKTLSDPKYIKIDRRIFNDEGAENLKKFLISRGVKML